MATFKRYHIYLFNAIYAGTQATRRSSTGVGNVFFPVCQVVKFNVKIYVCVPMSSLRFHIRFPYFSPKLRMFSKKKRSVNVFLKNAHDAACRIKSPRVPWLARVPGVADP